MLGATALQWAAQSWPRFFTLHSPKAMALAELALTQAQEVISSEYGVKFGLKEPRLFKNRTANAQEAHEAIRPSDVKMRAADLSSMEPDAQRLYDL